MANYFTEQDVISELQNRIHRSSATIVSAQLGFSLPYISDVKSGRRNVSEALAKQLGFRREIVFFAAALPPAPAPSRSVASREAEKFDDDSGTMAP